VEKNKSEVARGSGKAAYQTPAPPKLKLKTQKNHLWQARNFLFSSRRSAILLPLSERPLSKADISAA
jgi:hypothetical protein